MGFRGWNRMRTYMFMEDNDSLARRTIPEDIKAEFGFSYNELCEYLENNRKPNKNLDWEGFMKSGVVNQKFLDFLKDNNLNHIVTLKKIIEMNNSESPYLGCSSRIYSGDELTTKLVNYGLSEIGIRTVHQNLSVDDNPYVALSTAIDTLGNDKFQNLKTRRRTTLVKFMRSLHIDTQIYTQKTLTNTDEVLHGVGSKRRRVSKNAYPCSNKIVTVHNKKLQEDDIFRLGIIGTRTEEKLIVTMRFKRNYDGSYTKERCERQLVGRVIEIKYQVQKTLEELKELDFSLPNYSISMWLDSSPLSKIPMLMGCWKIVLTDGILNKLMSIRDAEKSKKIIDLLCNPKVFLLIPVPEKREFLQSIFSLYICKMIRNLEEDTIKVGEMSVEVNLTLFIADNKALQLVVGLNNGSYPCGVCYTPRKSFCNYVNGCRAVPRTISTTASRRANADSNSIDLGDVFMPFFYDDIGCCVKNLTIGIDTLHIIENVGVALLEAIYSTVSDKELAENTVRLSSGVRLKYGQSGAVLSNTTCSNVRDIFMTPNFFFVDDLWQNDNSDFVTKMKEVAASFRDIIAIMYSPPQLFNSNLLVCFYVKVYLFSKQLQQCFPPNENPSLYSLPYHQLVSHLPELCRKFYLPNLTTESFEALWKNLRRREKYFSTHRDDVTKNLFLFINYNQVLEAQFGSSSSDKTLSKITGVYYKRSVEKLLTSIYIPPELCCLSGKWTEDFCTLLWNISDAKLGTVYFRNENNNSVNFVFNDTTLFQVRSMGREEYIQYLETCYEDNPIKHLISNQKDNYNVLVDNVFEDSIDVSGTNGKSCIGIIKARLADLSKFDTHREQVLNPTYTDAAGRATYPVASLREKIRYDNSILKYRTKQIIPDRENAVEWHEYLKNEMQYFQALPVFYRKPDRVLDLPECLSTNWQRRNLDNWKRASVIQIKHHALCNNIKLRSSKKREIIQDMVEYYSEL